MGLNAKIYEHLFWYLLGILHVPSWTVMELCLHQAEDSFRNNHCFYERKTNHDTIKHINTYWKAVQMKMWYSCHSLGLLMKH